MDLEPIDTAPVSTEEPSVEQPQAIKMGDRLEAMSRQFADQMNGTETMTRLREKQLTLPEYRAFIERVYPIVVHFNYVLRSELTKLEDQLQDPRLKELADEVLTLDHVAESQKAQELARAMRNYMRSIASKDERTRLVPLRVWAGQYQEEQEHNDLYRVMLEEHSITDHQEGYQQFRQYLDSLTVEQRRGAIRKILENDTSRETPRAFPHTEHNQAVLAMHAYMSEIADNPNIPYALSHAVIAAIEFTLIKCVSESIYPGLTSYGSDQKFQLESVLQGLNPQLIVKRDEALAAQELPDELLWFDAHAGQGKSGAQEIGHIARGREILNDSVVNSEDIERVEAWTKNLLSLFVQIV